MNRLSNKGFSFKCIVSVSQLLMLMMLAGCQTPPQRSMTQEELINSQQDFLKAYQADLDNMNVKSASRLVSELQLPNSSPDSQQQTYDILVLSGGGAFGAFGAGFLKGWGQIEDVNIKRPEFDSISGISTGSLIAPFAFVGTPEAYNQIIELYQNPGADWVRERGIIPYLPGNVSLYDVSKLHERIKLVITPELIKELAKGAVDGRQLLVGATNMDYGLLRVWDLTEVAANSSPEDAIEQTVSILSASTAIPGLFPPVLIDNFLYVDGGATMQVVGGMDERRWAYSDKNQALDYISTSKPIKIRVWIIVNQKLLTDPKVVRTRWTSIAARSLNTLLRSSMLQSIQDAETFVGLLNSRDEFEAQMRYVAIPQDYPIEDSDEMFDVEIMRKLVVLGLKMGADPASWKSEALRPAAPFELEKNSPLR